MNEYVEKEILILVKTYPTPSLKYDETVCTAGMTKEGELIRIYPIDFRYLDKEQQFGKYEWIKANVAKNDRDTRLESYKVDRDSISRTGIELKKWEQRMRVLKPLVHNSLEELEAKNMSLGIIKPKAIHNLIYVDDDEEWGEKQQASQFQLTIDNLLRGKEKLQLAKIPYKFQYQFNDGSEHKIAMRDWELFALFLKYYHTGKENAAKKVYQKFFTEICDLSKRDVYFLVGTQHPYYTWLILGLIYPPKGTLEKLSQPSIEDFL